MTKALTLRANQLDDRLGRLTDAFVDGLIEKQIFEERKKRLLIERQGLKSDLARLQSSPLQPVDELEHFLERAKSAYLAYKDGAAVDKRDLIDSVTSNRWIDRKTPDISLVLPFSEVANRLQSSGGDPERGVARTWTPLLKHLLEVLSGTFMSQTGARDHAA